MDRIVCGRSLGSPHPHSPMIAVPRKEYLNENWSRKHHCPCIVTTAAESSLSIPASLSFIAREKGFWKAQGLDVKVVSFAAGRLALDAMLNGQAQFVTAAETPLAMGAFQHKSDTIIAEMMNTVSMPQRIPLWSRNSYEVSLRPSNSYGNIQTRRSGSWPSKSASDQPISNSSTTNISSP